MQALHVATRNWIVISSGFFVMAVLGTLAHARSPLPLAWMDNATGYAISGYDPVDYFVMGRANRPNTRIEAVWGGVSWRFRNEGNKAAFLAHPHIYAPRFGGIDPYQLANHHSVRGNPTLFDIYEKRLYLFYDGTSLLRWKQARKEYIKRAALAWPKAAASLGLGIVKIKKKAPVKPENKNGFLFPRPNNAPKTD